jgi:class 3 adenylate cyclase/tetratricopeptide (TPR) repeat protein
MEHGTEGAEVLTELIRAVFAPAIGTIHEAGGFVSTFAGDAFTAIFTHPPPVPLPELARRLAADFQRARQQPTRLGDYEITARIGLASGAVQWGIISADPSAAYYFRGPAVQAAADACSECTPGSTRVSPELASPPAPVSSPTGGDGREEEVLRFVPEAVLRRRTLGEFRDIVSCMLSFDEDDDFVSGIAQTMRHAEAFGGYVNKVDFGDKGGVVLVLFGAPVGRENLHARACDFCLAVRQIPDFRTRIGLSFGRVFAGFVGSELRREYTALGDVVNRSARLAFQASWQDACADHTVQAHTAAFRFDHLRDATLKGFSSSVPIYALRARSSRQHRTFEGPFLGRSAELEALARCCAPLQHGEPGGIVYVDGHAGAGKSRLVHAFLQSHAAAGATVYFWPCDEILRKSFNPVNRFLSERFGQSDEASPEENRRAFTARYDDLLAEADDALGERLEEARSFLAAPLGLRWEDSPYENADEKMRYLGFIQGVRTLVRAEAARAPVVLILEDAQWIEADTLELLRVLTADLEHVPLLIVCPCRYTDEGLPVRLALDGVAESRIALERLDRAAAESLVSYHLESAWQRPIAISDELLQLVLERSEGNPFYIEQLIYYLAETGGIDPDTGRPTSELTVPPGINMVITARLDRLERELMSVIKAAAVLGPEFSIRVLAAMLRDARIDDELTAGTGENIWQELSGQYYGFRHGLIRESAYEMQLKQQLRSLHRLAAEAFEALHSDDLSPVFAELAEHYERAEVTDKAVHYLERAAEQARRAYHNPAALDFYARLLALLPSEDCSRTFDALTGTAQVLKLLGRWDEAQEIFAQTVSMAETAGDRRRLLTATINIGDILRFRGEYDEAMDWRTRGLELARDLDDDSSTATLLGNIGNIFLCKGQVDEAIEYYEQQRSLATRLGNVREMSLAAGNLGICHGRKGDVVRAMEHYEQQRRLASETGDKQSVAIATGNIGILHRRAGRLADAMACYEAQLQLVKEIGDKNSMAVVLGNMGGLNVELRDDDRARELCEAQVALAEELGDRRCLAHGCGLLGKLAERRNDRAAARSFFERQLELSRDLDNQRGIAAAVAGLERLGTSD